MNLRKVLIIRFSSIGDIVLTTPVVRNLKVQLGETEIHYCTKKQFEPILRANPYIDKIYTLESSLNALISQLKTEKYDLIIDLHHNLRTFIIKILLGKQAYSFDKLNFEKWLMVNLKINRLPNRHIVDRYMDTVKPLGIKVDNLGLDYFIPENDEVEQEWIPETHRKEFVIFAIGGNHNTKKLPFEKMIELCDRINKPVILIGGNEDAETGESIKRFFDENTDYPGYEPGLRKMGKKTIIFNGCGKFSVNQSASLIKKASYVFTHDTGMMHIAAAFKKQVYSIWGNTIPLFGMYPYKTKFVVFENNHLNCRPCSKIGYDKCPKGHFKCMKDMVFDFYLP